MIRINLLPYRAQRRQRQILEHIAILLGVVLITGLTIFTVDWVKHMELTDLEDQLSDLKAQNAKLMQQIGKIRDLDKLRADVERKLELVDTLQKGRFHSLETLNELAKVIPENVWLTSISDNSDTISISGFGESNKAVANFMRALDQSKIITNVSLKTITRTMSGNVPVRSFSLTLTRIERDKEPATGTPGGKQSPKPTAKEGA